MIQEEEEEKSRFQDLKEIKSDADSLRIGLTGDVRTCMGLGFRVRTDEEGCG